MLFQDQQRVEPRGCLLAVVIACHVLEGELLRVMERRLESQLHLLCAFVQALLVLLFSLRHALQVFKVFKGLEPGSINQISIHTEQICPYLSVAYIQLTLALQGIGFKEK